MTVDVVDVECTPLLPIDGSEIQLLCQQTSGWWINSKVFTFEIA